MKTVISIQGLNKGYKKQSVLSNLNWTIEQGDVIGLLGKNGAGKSTLLKSLLNIIEIDEGNIEIFGEPHNNLSLASKERISYVPQENDEIQWLSVDDLIKFRKQFYQQWSDKKVHQLIARWEIDKTKKIADLSPGQVQRVLIILALASLPDLIIFDEPAASLDPAGRRDFLKEIVMLASNEKITIIFSTHIVSDLERVANKVAILDKGSICYFDDLDNFKENVVQLSIANQAVNTNINVPHVLRTRKNTQESNYVVSQLDHHWISKMQAQGVNVQVNAMALEDIFLELTA